MDKGNMTCRKPLLCITPYTMVCEVNNMWSKCHIKFVDSTFILLMLIPERCCPCRRTVYDFPEHSHVPSSIIDALTAWSEFRHDIPGGPSCFEQSHDSCILCNISIKYACPANVFVLLLYHKDVSTTLTPLSRQVLYNRGIGVQRNKTVNNVVKWNRKLYHNIIFCSLWRWCILQGMCYFRKLMHLKQPLERRRNHMRYHNTVSLICQVSCSWLLGISRTCG